VSCGQGFVKGGFDRVGGPIYVLTRPDFPRLIGVLAGCFFENWEKPARFLDLLLEPFLPMPI
jgi:hypothetical protein